MAEPPRSRPVHLQLVAISWNFGWPIAAGVVFGHWLDGKLGTSPAATLLLGIGALAVSVWRLLELSRQEQAARLQEEHHSAAREGERKAEPGRESPEPGLAEGAKQPEPADEELDLDRLEEELEAELRDEKDEMEAGLRDDKNPREGR